MTLKFLKKIINMQPTLILHFKHEGKSYKIIEEKTNSIWKEENSDHYNMFWWEDGNGACDCNRSIFIREQFPDFPELQCGHTIDLEDYEIIEND